MKFPALLTCVLALLLAAVPLHRAHADEVNFDVFYNSLSDDGDWYNTPEYGYVWQPFVAYKTDKWRPYADGYWAQTDDGWTWVSYENFGWATYHYGRWTRLKDTGWVWVPGYDWGPGWVSWRTNDDYVGWAPLPPKSEEGVYEGRVVEPRRSQVEQIDYNDVEPEDAGYGTNVDVQYDIGPANYCFVETRNFGAPVLGAVLLPPQQNFVFIERTRNVTNIYYRRERDRTVVYNNGPDFGFINSRVERPIQRLQLERRDDPGYLRDGLRGGGNPSLVRNGVLQVASPTIARRAMNFTQMKPTRIKQTLTQPQVVRGWTNAGTDQAATQRIREQYKQQAAAAPARPANPVIPPAGPARERVEERAAGNTPPAPAGAQPFVGRQPGQAGAAPQAPLTEADRIARRDARQKEREQRANGGQPAPAPGAPAAAAQGNAEQEKEARRAARQSARANGQPVPSVAPNPSAQGNAEPDKEARRAARQAARANGQPAAPAAPAEAAPANADQEKEARRAARQAARANGQPAKPEEAAPAAQPQNNRTDEERAARRGARQQEPPAAQAQPQTNGAQADQEKEARRAARQQERAAQPAAPQVQPAPQADAEREARRAARQQERAAQPQQQAQPAAQEQEARRAARQQERAAQPQQPQAQPAAQEQEARRAARQQERAAQPQQPQAQPQGGNANRETRQEQPRPGKPGQTPSQ